MLNGRGAKAAISMAALAVILLASSPAVSAPATTAPPPTSSSSPASAPGPAAESPFGGPSIPGVCLLSKEALVAGSKLGQATQARLEQLGQQVQAKAAAALTSFNSAKRALAAQQASLPQIQFAQKAAALSERGQMLQAAEQQRAQQLDATRAKALQHVFEEANPLVIAAYRDHGCGVLFDRNAVFAGGVGMDITPQVVQALDAKVTTTTFDLERGAGAER
jgi:Skp family chaperone for outer membrane proteins